MKKAYEEEKITREIRRYLSHLDEACEEQGITIEDAVAWWQNIKKVEIRKKEEVPKEYASFREKAEDFVGKYVDGVKKEICVETLCFLRGKEKCPSSVEIVEAVASKVVIIECKRYLSDYIRDVIAEFVKLVEYNGMPVRSRIYWGSLKKRVLILANGL